ncbi:hypothetical protein CEXT_209061 [Caerostris extrusa]|uniref:Ycf15 n=1 Tax=Caerostris extrusa TaxID=172846 RepID=A0AAV4MJD6_CAEEX|nr:hypothetical protein CEXT_209061 [Caerostris extrusa]
MHFYPCIHFGKLISKHSSSLPDFIDDLVFFWFRSERRAFADPHRAKFWREQDRASLSPELLLGRPPTTAPILTTAPRGTPRPSLAKLPTSTARYANLVTGQLGL